MKKYLLFLVLICGCQQPDRDIAQALGAMVDPDDKGQRGLTQDDRDRLERHYPFTLKRIDSHKHLNVQDIKNLTRAGVSDEVIIDLISSTRSTFYLTPKEEQELEQAGVSNYVIQTMRSTTNAIGKAPFHYIIKKYDHNHHKR